MTVVAFDVFHEVRQFVVVSVGLLADHHVSSWSCAHLQIHSLASLPVLLGHERNQIEYPLGSGGQDHSLLVVYYVPNYKWKWATLDFCLFVFLGSLQEVRAFHGVFFWGLLVASILDGNCRASVVVVEGSCGCCVTCSVSVSCVDLFWIFLGG